MSVSTARLFIRGLSTVSPLGAAQAEIQSTLERNEGSFGFTEGEAPVFRVTPSGTKLLEALAIDPRLRKLDRVSLLALAAADGCFSQVRHVVDGVCGVSIGSSRGPTGALEEAVAAFTREPGQPLPSETSPATTAGNISGWVGQRLLESLGGNDSDDLAGLIYLGTSMTCSSAFQSLVAGLGLVRAGFGSAWVFGGAESCLTPFTIAQLRALRLYSRGDARFPCRPCQLGTQAGGGRENSVVLGEAAGVAVLTTDGTALSASDLELVGIGWATERIPSATGISPDGRLFEASMGQALAEPAVRARVGGVLLHSPGSVHGDGAEQSAVERFFGAHIPVWSTKHLTGHSYGASGMVSLAVAREALCGLALRAPDYPNGFGEIRITPGDVLVINTAGFGGTAVSVAVTTATG